ncbi:MAG: Gfo/Idh/MocA family oxidoreductase [Candidatus Aureabacteria bacterium]|nr:Gfo/Idh/MocA family oxidoreductase [Candidatus Auribacterota bacterium]
MDSPETSKVVTCAIIGCGWWGPRLIRTFHRLPGARVKTVADLKEERLNLITETYPEIAVTRDYTQILLDPEIDAVCVATPTESHYAIARDVLNAGKHLLLEKPMTVSRRESAALQQSALEKRLTLLVDHIFLYDPAVAFLKQCIGAGEMGNLYYVDSARINLPPPDATVNVLWDLAPHDISICLHLFGELPQCVAAQGMRYRHTQLEDAASLYLYFPGGKLARIHVSWLSSCKTRVMRIFGSEKSAFYDGGSPKDRVQIFGPGKDTRLAPGGATPLQHSYGPDTVTIPPLPDTEPLYAEGLDFLECVSTGKEPVSSGRTGHLVVSILEAASVSMKRMGGMVKVRT